jgi:hypothetical protein
MSFFACQIGPNVSDWFQLWPGPVHYRASPALHDLTELAPLAVAALAVAALAVAATLAVAAALAVAIAGRGVPLSIGCPATPALG